MSGGRLLNGAAGRLSPDVSGAAERFLSVLDDIAVRRGWSAGVRLVLTAGNVRVPTSGALPELPP
jgi:hypothetical protein